MKHLLAALLMVAAALAAQAPARATGTISSAVGAYPVIPWLHTRWLVRDGAPPNVVAMAQTPDGWIWLGSSVGLFRFDGVSFRRFHPPSGVNLPSNIKDLKVLSDGRLTVTSRYGEVFLIKGQEIREVQLNGITDVVLDDEGKLWAGSTRGLFREDGDGSLQEIGKSLGLPEAVSELMLDRQGRLWVMGFRGNYMRLPGGRFERVSDKIGFGRLREAPNGTVWATDMGIGGMRRLSPENPDTRLDAFLGKINTANFHIDRSGHMWFAMSGGVARVELGAQGPKMQAFTRQHGLSGQNSDTVFEDREGNIWVSTASGLDQFRPGRVREIALPEYLSEARPIAAGAAGDVWIDRFHLASPTARAQAFSRETSQNSLISALYVDGKGTLWAGALDGIWQVEGLRRTKVPPPPEFARWIQVPIFAITTDAEGALWISVGALGTFRRKDGVWTEHGGIPALRRFGTTTFALAPDGGLWFGSVKNTVAILRGGAVRKLGPDDGIDLGTVAQIVHHGKGTYLGGDLGVAYYDGRRAARMLGKGGEAFAGATGLVMTPEGELWANTARGLVHVAAQELARFVANPTYQVQFRRYDENDGLFGGAPALTPVPSVVRTTGGDLVVSTVSSVFHLDPARIEVNKVAPPVEVTAIAVDGREHPVKPGLTLGAAPDTVRIDYAALSYTLPQRVRFQYMLEGVDRGWQDAGDRRSAYYTRLAPGDYRFRVKAANEDGVWNEEGAHIAFNIPPTPTQTRAFKLLCGALLLLAAWGLHRLRMRVAVRRLSRGFEARVAERERIARDLHDTLLQSVQGLILSFERISRRTPASAPTRPMMEDALALATEVLEEGRDKVGGLRGEAGPGDLAEALTVFGRRLADQHPVRFALARTGRPRLLRPAVHDELLSIGREAIQNAFLHARANEIAVELAFNERAFELVVRDDGRGIDPALQDGRPGHWGIPGMRERAAQLGATLELSSAAGNGSRWRLQLPARLAYAAQDAGDKAGNALSESQTVER